MRVLDHTPGARIEFGGEFEPPPFGQGCLPSCTLGCLTPLAVAVALHFLEVHPLDGIALAIWVSLTFIGLLATGSFGHEPDQVSDLVLDRRDGTIRARAARRRDSGSETSIPISDVHAMELKVVDLDGYRTEVELSLIGPVIEERREGLRGRIGLSLLLVLLRALLFLVPRRRKEREPAEDRDVVRREGEQDLPSRQFDLGLDGLGPDPLPRLAAEIAAVLQLPYRGGEGSEGARSVRYQRVPGIPNEARSVEVEVSPVRIPLAPGPTLEETEANALPPGVRVDGARVRVRDTDGQASLGFLIAAAVGFAILTPGAWIPTGEEWLRDLLRGAVLAAGLAGAAYYRLSVGTRAVILDRERRLVDVRRGGSTSALSYSEIERVVRVEGSDGTVVLETARGPLCLPIDASEVDEEFRDAIARTFARSIGVEAWSYPTSVQARGPASEPENHAADSDGADSDRSPRT